jgi:hypothetical protein
MFPMWGVDLSRIAKIARKQKRGFSLWCGLPGGIKKPTKGSCSRRASISSEDREDSQAEKVRTLQRDRKIGRSKIKD